MPLKHNVDCAGCTQGRCTVYTKENECVSGVDVLQFLCPVCEEPSKAVAGTCSFVEKIPERGITAKLVRV